MSKERCNDCKFFEFGLEDSESWRYWVLFLTSPPLKVAGYIVNPIKKFIKARIS